MKIKVYIAGPMRGIPEFNFPAFHDAAKQLRQLGYLVFNPAEFDQIFCLDPKIAQPIHDYIRRDVHIIINELTPGRDGVVLLPGWAYSSGATAEHALAKWCGLNIWTLAGILGE